MSFLIQKEIQFDAGHRVPLHTSKCKNPHGHRYRVEAGLMGELITEGPESGMVKDFGYVKEVLTHYVHDVYDHGFIVHKEDTKMLEALGISLGGPYISKHGWKTIVVDFIPTAECLARDIYDAIKTEIPDLVYVKVWETPTSVAAYSEDD